MQSLVENLRLREVAPEAHLAGRAERARERAAALRRDADRAPPVPVAHQHRLDGMAVTGAEQRLDGSVLRTRLVLDLERRERHALGEARAQRGREVRHLLVAGRAARRPLPHLARAIDGLVLQFLFERSEIHPDRVDAAYSAFACAS